MGLLFYRPIGLLGFIDTYTSQDTNKEINRESNPQNMTPGKK